MVQIGSGALLGIGVTILLGMIVAIYKGSANILAVSQNISQMNNNLATKLDSLNGNISEMNGELRRISETTTRVETKFNESSPNAKHSTESNSDRDVETDGATEVVRPDTDTTPEGRFTLPSLGRVVHMDVDFDINSDGEEVSIVTITFPRELLVKTQRLNPDLRVLSKGFVGTPNAISKLRRTTTVILPTSDSDVVADWMNATATLLDNEEYYESIEGVNKEELEENVQDVLADVDELEDPLDDLLDSADEPNGEDKSADDFTL